MQLADRLDELWGLSGDRYHSCLHFLSGKANTKLRKLKRQTASIPLEPALSHQSTLVEILYYSHYLFLIVQDRTQHGDRMS